MENRTWEKIMTGLQGHDNCDLVPVRHGDARERPKDEAHQDKWEE
jgi:hypothetical protein